MTGYTDILRPEVRTMVNREDAQELNQLKDSIESLKIEVSSLKDEFHNIEDTILKDRLKSVENALAQNRLVLYANQLEENLPADFFKLMKHGCESQQKCAKASQVAISGNLELIKKSKIKEAFTDLDLRIESAKRFLEESKKPECNPCYQNVLDKLKREKRTFQTIASVEKSWKKQKPSKIDISFILKSFLEPISNQNRLSILFSLYERKRSFTELSQVTGQSGGPLIFHIKKLIRAKLIAQEGNKGDYIITQKGIGALNLISSIQQEK